MPESKKLLNKIEAGVGAFGFLYSLAGSTPKYAKYMTWWANAILFVITTFLMGYEYAIRRRGMYFPAVAVPSKKYRTIWQDPLSKTAAIDNAAGARVVSCFQDSQNQRRNASFAPAWQWFSLGR